MRHATHDDIAALIELGRPFLSAHPLLQSVAITDEQLQGALTNIIDRGVIIVAESIDGSLVGMLAGMICPVWCAPETLVATELAWWMKPGNRHGMTAIRMVKDFEDWASQRGATHFVMSSIPSFGPRSSQLIERLGYQLVETAFAK
jgi:hypothetical protein